MKTSVNLGLVSSFSRFPTEILLRGKKYFLSKRVDGEYILLSSTCPHMGGNVQDAGQYFECDLHQWQFRHDNGQCIKTPKNALASYYVSEHDGYLFAELPDGELKAESSGEFIRKTAFPKDLSITLQSHSCLEFRYKEYSLLTDPWLVGPAFSGGWMLYPEPKIRVQDVRPSAIAISHEHSDHFHIETLRYLDHSIPIFCPDFPNERIQQQLDAEGFFNICVVPFGETVHLNSSIKLTFFEPISVWNDSLMLIEIENFRMLNANDAGLNKRIATQIGPVDAFASAFGAGASGYPLTWTHINDEKKIEVCERARQGNLAMLQQAMSLYQAQYLLPYASHWHLWHPSHERLFPLFTMNTLDDVVQYMKGTMIDVIDLLPGEIWLPYDHSIIRQNYNRDTIYDKQTMHKYAKENFARNHETFDNYYSPYSSNSLTRNGLVEYFLNLNAVTEIIFCEDMSMTVYATDKEKRHIYFEVSITITDHVLSVCAEPLQKPGMTMKMPVELLAKAVHGDISWDELHIGFWGEFSRNPDVYHLGFWRLIQSPYYKRHLSSTVSLKGRDDSAAQNAWERFPIAQILNNYGKPADRILRRYGLYCWGCNYSPAETIRSAAQAHGVSAEQVDRLVEELHELFDLEFKDEKNLLT
jgi:CMP-N-acetylneuraminate monooxygenase